MNEENDVIAGPALLFGGEWLWPEDEFVEAQQALAHPEYDDSIHLP